MMTPRFSCALSSALRIADSMSMRSLLFHGGSRWRRCGQLSARSSRHESHIINTSTRRMNGSPPSAGGLHSLLIGLFGSALGVVAPRMVESFLPRHGAIACLITDSGTHADSSRQPILKPMPRKSENSSKVRAGVSCERDDG